MIDLVAAAGMFQNESHQIAALNAVWLVMTPQQKVEFSETFTSGPPLPPIIPCPSMAEIRQRHQEAA